MSIDDIIKGYEGLRLKPYRCPAGKLTIGYGFNLEEGIPEFIADDLLDYSISIARRDLRSVLYPNGILTAKNITNTRLRALIDLMYNLGKTKFLTFKKMIQAIKEGDWNKAADELLNSKYAEQVGIRAIENAERLRNG
jgi:lysozyme